MSELLPRSKSIGSMKTVRVDLNIPLDAPFCGLCRKGTKNRVIVYMGFAKKWSFFLKLFQRRSIGEGEEGRNVDNGEKIRNPNIEIRNKAQIPKGGK